MKYIFKPECCFSGEFISVMPYNQPKWHAGPTNFSRRADLGTYGSRQWMNEKGRDA